MQIGLFTQILLPHNFYTFILFLLTLVFPRHMETQMLYSFVVALTLLPQWSWCPKRLLNQAIWVELPCLSLGRQFGFFVVLPDHRRVDPKLNPFCLVELCDLCHYSLAKRGKFASSHLKSLGGRMCFLLTFRRVADLARSHRVDSSWPGFCHKAAYGGDLPINSI